MRFIERLNKPLILEQKEAEWTAVFLENQDKKRPDGSKYGHKQIREQLNTMSFHKCFYCESKLKGVSQEIDHYEEVSETESRKLAYIWTNLYLACTNCNNKVPNKTIAVTDALNPCFHQDSEIEEHLTFTKELITAKNGSVLGLNTIKKFRLNNASLDYLRLQRLQEFYKVSAKIKDRQIKDGGRIMNDAERQSLKFFAQPDQSFSLMFRLLLKKYNI